MLYLTALPVSRFFMKISKLFHWLYAILMFLPIVNVFAYTLRYGFNYGHEIPVVSENVQETVNFNQVFEVVPDSVNNSFSVVDKSTIVFNVDTLVYPYLDVDFVDGNIYVVRCTNKTGDFDTCNLWNSIYNQQFNFNTGSEYRFTCSNIPYLLQVQADIDSSISFNLFNLTQMFGSGDEPSLEQFDAWFPDQNYDYTLSDYVVIPDYSSVSVSDDVTNHFWLPSFGQVGYTINNVIGYLLFNVFGLVVSEGIGSIVCGLFTYWLIISLAWLVFDLLMYVPQLVHRWLDKASIS